MEPRVILREPSGATLTFERIRDDPANRWQEVHGSRYGTGTRQGDPISAEDLLERVRAVVLRDNAD